MEGNLPAFPSIRKCPRDARSKSAFPLNMIGVFKNTYFWNSMAPQNKPASSSGAHLLENQKENWLYLSLQWSIFLKAFQEFLCLSVILTDSLPLECNPLICDSTAVHS